jgi:hypothetical protein
MPDYSVLSGSGLTLMPTQLTITGKNVGQIFLDIPAFRHLHMIFQHHRKSLTPATAVHGRAWCITWTCRVYSFPVSSIEVQGVALFTFFQFFVMPEC